MANPLTVWTLFETHQQLLGLRWVTGLDGKYKEIDNTVQTNSNKSSTSMLIGHMNCVHPNRIQVIGSTEMDYFTRLSKPAFDEILGQLFDTQPAAIIICDDLIPPAELIDKANRHAIPLLTALATDHDLINSIFYYLNKELAESLVLHGVFMEVVGIGVLLTGESGIGKSELALELLSRGHRLIADDAPEYSRYAPDTINGTCPLPLRDFLEVRGLGILNIRAMFGDSAIKRTKNLRLIVHLEHMSEVQIGQIDRLNRSKEVQRIFGVDIPKVTIPVAPGRNIAVIVESAARNQILMDKGYDATKRFIQQQQEYINKGIS